MENAISPLHSQLQQFVRRARGRHDVGRALRRLRGRPDAPTRVSASDSRREQSRARAAADIALASRTLGSLGRDDGVVLGQFPDVHSNPFQALITTRAWENGFAPVGIRRASDILELAAVHASGLRSVLHIHWTSAVLSKAGQGEAGMHAIRSYLAALDAYNAAGGRIVWTIHNLLPHDTAAPDLDLQLQRGIVERAHLVHVLAAGTIDEARGLFDVPANKLLHVPHPTFAGAYPDILPRESARLRLGLEPGAVVYGFIGSIRRNKGLGDLVSAFESLGPDSRERRLIIAGSADGSEETRRDLETARANPGIKTFVGSIPGDDLQLYLRACDAIVMPYRSGLNSGVLLLAYTFGLPVVASDFGAAKELVTASSGRVYRSGDVTELAAALRSVEVLFATPEKRRATTAAIAAIAARYRPEDVSDALMQALRTRLW